MSRTVTNPVVRETIYDKRVNSIRLKMSTYNPDTDTDTPISWVNVTRLVLNLYVDPTYSAPAFTVDTQTQATAIDKSTDGYLTFNLGAVTPTITAGSYRVRLTAVDNLSNKTELISERNPEQRVIFDYFPTATVT